MRSLGSKSGNTLARELIEDVIDTLRSLRCADALRQRGTVLKTSGNREIFVDQRTANAIYALRPDDQHLCLLEIPDQINAGEANLSSQLDADGNLRISFYHGMFTDQETVLKAARCAALVVNDIQEDAIGSFERSDGATHPELKRRADVSILIESVNEPDILAKRGDVLSPRMIRIMEDLSGDWRRLDERIQHVTARTSSSAGAPPRIRPKDIALSNVHAPGNALTGFPPASVKVGWPMPSSGMGPVPIKPFSDWKNTVSGQQARSWPPMLECQCQDLQAFLTATRAQCAWR